MNKDEKWFNFRYQHIETGWFDYDRHKTIEGMRNLSERVPDVVQDNLPARIVFAPSAARLGHVLPCGTGDSIFVYLSPHLESKSQAEVDFTVAHEFAHVVLGHYKPGATTYPSSLTFEKHEDALSEQDADKLAESWGFAHPKTRRHGRELCGSRRGAMSDAEKKRIVDDMLKQRLEGRGETDSEAEAIHQILASVANLPDDASMIVKPDGSKVDARTI